MSRVGIYSGTFDPIHNGHIAFAKEAIRKNIVDDVYFLVEAKPRRKENVSDYTHRLNMAWLATHDHPNLHILTMDHETFSVQETLPWLEEKFGEVAMLMGSDLAKLMHTWPGFNDLVRKVQFIIGERENEPVGELPAEFVRLVTAEAHQTSSKIRNNLEAHIDGVSKEVAQYIQSHKLYTVKAPIGR